MCAGYNGLLSLKGINIHQIETNLFQTTSKNQTARVSGTPCSNGKALNWPTSKQ